MRLLEALDLRKARRIEIVYPADKDFDIVVLEKGDFEFITADRDTLYVWYKNALGQRRLKAYNLRIARSVYIAFEEEKENEVHNG